MMLQVTPRRIGSAYSEDQLTIYTRVSTGVKEPVGNTSKKQWQL